MITIGSYLHRDALRDLIQRWMYGNPQRTDGDDLAQLVYFNNAYVSRYLAAFSEQIFQRFHPHALQVRKVCLKGDLKNVIVTNVPYRNARVDEILNAYRCSPELYYRETPFHGNLFFSGGPDGSCYIGSNRIKRVRRLAEKSARRIIDRLYATIKRRAEDLAEDRARLKGISREHLITPPEDMTAEFLKAESRVLDDLRQGQPIRDADGLVIQDVAGLKAIVEQTDRSRFMDLIGNMRGCEVIEIEPHTGRYNAVNLIVRLRPDREQLASIPLGARLINVMRMRGAAPAAANRAFREFILSGEDSVNLEVILSDYQEMLESEIGRCMHEDRIIRQRLEQQYNGQLARNIEYLMGYLFMLPASKRVESEQTPIKLWYRYLPDYFDEVLKRLFNIPSVEVLD
ncbi:MAG: hypothetical protein U5R30_06030 [Deltaproteobacteria bacterium]|nr:hypothetical protein [Deltaproteobacteria bacterium]